MFLLEYNYADISTNGWKIENLSLQKMNLFVGLSGAGKTKILNTIFNLSLLVTSGHSVNNGHWILKFKISNSEDIYVWEICIENFLIIKEKLEKGSMLIINRDSRSFTYNEIELPQLDNSQSALRLLKNDSIIENISKDFKKIIRRNFFDGELENQSSIATFDENLILQNTNLDWNDGLNVNVLTLPMVVRLSILQKLNPSQWEDIKKSFLDLFPNFQDIFISNIGINQKQIFVKENDEDIILNELSAGEKKALLIISDVVTMSKNSIYLLDEIENSLGTNIINELTEFLLERIFDIQFIITSHHPYIINTIPYTNWKLIKRNRKKINIIDGNALSDDFKLSKHDAFIKLQNMVK